VTTPYMALTLPVVSATLGPEWASELNAALALIDSHDHSSGKGTPVRSNGIYLDSDLDCHNINLKTLRSSRYTAQGSPLSGVSDVCCIYFSGADLYANDAVGNQVQITSGGGVAGSPGSISGLVSPASVVYTPASTIFNFYSASTVRASLACGPLTIAEAVASGKGVTISVPTALAANYALELPAALPASTKFMTLSAAGLIGVGPDVASGIDTANLADGAVTPSKKAALGQQVSASCGLFTTTSLTDVDVTNLTVTITTTGRPILIALIADGTGNGAEFSAYAGSGSSVAANLHLVRDSTEIAQWNLSLGTGISGAPGIYSPITPLHIDVISAGTYTYKIQTDSDTSGGTVRVYNYKLIAFEL
jgi:hypothetical protein